MEVDGFDDHGFPLPDAPLTSRPLSTTVPVREGDTGLGIETPGSVGSTESVSPKAGSAKIVWGGASNVAPKRRTRAQRTDWICAACKLAGNRSVVIPRYMVQCPHGHRRH